MKLRSRVTVGGIRGDGSESESGRKAWGQDGNTRWQVAGSLSLSNYRDLEACSLMGVSERVLPGATLPKWV